MATARPIGEAVFRFAPSPTGRLHAGHARSALLGFDLAMRLGGRFLVRIEDIDRQRCRPVFIEDCLEDLAWLGIRWEQPVLRQSEHMVRYQAAAARLEALGVLYPCFATRSEILSAADPTRLDPDGAPIYPGLWRDAPAADIARRKAAQEPYAMRIDMTRALGLVAERLGGRPLTFTELALDGHHRAVDAAPEHWGDAVIVRKEFPASYHLAVVVDDADQGVSHVTRGQDLFAATGIHRVLQVLLALPEPLYLHHPLLVDAAGRKLAKRAGDPSILAIRRAGGSPHDVIAAARLSIGDGVQNWPASSPQSVASNP